MNIGTLEAYPQRQSFGTIKSDGEEILVESCGFGSKVGDTLIFDIVCVGPKKSFKRAINVENLVSLCESIERIFVYKEPQTELQELFSKMDLLLSRISQSEIDQLNEQKNRFAKDGFDRYYKIKRNQK